MRSSVIEERTIHPCDEKGASGCVVLGYPQFYGRFGFQPVRDLILPDVPAEYFLAVLGNTTPAGTVSYHEAFNAVD